MKLGETGPFDIPRRTSIPWCKSTGLNVSESRGSAKDGKYLQDSDEQYQISKPLNNLAYWCQE